MKGMTYLLGRLLTLGQAFGTLLLIALVGRLVLALALLCDVSNVSLYKGQVTYADEAPGAEDLRTRAELGRPVLRKCNRRGSSQTHERSEEHSELHDA